MKIFKWNVGLKGLITGGLALVAATLVGKVATDAIEDSVTKAESKDTENEEKDVVLEEVPNKGDDSEESDDEIEIKEF